MAQMVLSYQTGIIKSRAVTVFPKQNRGGCCCSCSCSTTEKSDLVVFGGNKVAAIERVVDGEKECLVSEYGWNVRRLVVEDSEIRRVSHLQAEAFHVPVLLFNDVFFEFFKAEVLSGLLYKLRNSPPDRYACLVAEQNTRESNPKLVGVVDITVQREPPVLQHLPGAQEYVYVSGLAVSKSFRRRKIASVLLKACDVLAKLWRFEYLVLRAYEDDSGARSLYSKAGYRVVSGDPPWLSSWIGRKRRIVMIKRLYNVL